MSRLQQGWTPDRGAGEGCDQGCRKENGAVSAGVRLAYGVTKRVSGRSRSTVGSRVRRLETAHEFESRTLCKGSWKVASMVDSQS